MKAVKRGEALAALAVMLGIGGGAVIAINLSEPVTIPARHVTTSEPSASSTTSDGALAPAESVDAHLPTPSPSEEPTGPSDGTPEEAIASESPAPAETPVQVLSDPEEEVPGAVAPEVTVSEEMGINPSAGVAEIRHWVQPGQTLAEISHQYGISVDALAARNNLVDVHLIYEGSDVVIPVPAG